MSSSNTLNIDRSNVPVRAHVHGVTLLCHRQQAANYLEQGHRVTDQQGFDLKIETRDDGIRQLVRASPDDVAGAEEERHKTETAVAAAMEGDLGRSAGLPERELTDYEAGRVHPLDCGIANCDHPVHFGGSETGELKFEKAEEPKAEEEKRVTPKK
ncbi:uncharacterized protein LTR77_005522 [Saxophila tyrrhenica]|uniref:Uncharacterized protein n=1 Tax=Saxophila tyrrhenica TaxID=1690608 RepID=A0AAV9P8P3_9PEZI|nr:hypothetical protein LTR77_005522 [Saxophila tyrrhenica]